MLKTDNSFPYMLYFVILTYLWLMKGKIHDKSVEYKIFNLNLQAVKSLLLVALTVFAVGF